MSCFLCATALMTAGAHAQPEKSSVVVVHTSKDRTTGESGYGVAWKQPDNIVTVLHLVAGKPHILVSWNGKESPAKIKRLHKEADLALLELQTPLGIPAVEMIILVESADTKAGAMKVKDWYKEYIVSDGRRWEQEEGNDDDVDDELWNDPDEPYYSELMDRVVYDDDDEVVAELYASITVDGKNFLGVTVMADDWVQLTRAQRLSYYLMEACAILSDFAFY